MRTTLALALGLGLSLVLARPVAAAPAPAGAATPGDGDGLGDDAAEREEALAFAVKRAWAYLKEDALADAQEIGEGLIAGDPQGVAAFAGLELLAQVADRAPLDRRVAAIGGVLERIEATTPSSPEAAAARDRAWIRALELRGRANLQRGVEGDRLAFLACADDYRRSAALHGEGDSRRAVPLLYAAECTAGGPEPLDALPLFREILERYPSKAQYAIEGLVFLHLGVAHFAEAAALMERYVALYPKDMRAPKFNRQALAIRVALGQVSEAKRDAEAAFLLFGRKDPERAAEADWSLRALAKDDRSRREHAEAYLKRYNHKGGVDRQIVAEATLGEIEWRSACPVPETLGLCLAPPPRPTKKTSKARRCGPAPRAVLPRRAAAADAAQKRLSAVAKLARARIDIPEEERARVWEFRQAVAMSQLRALDRDLEAFFALEAPRDLVLTVDPKLAERDPHAHRTRLRLVDDSRRRLVMFLADLRHQSAKLVEGYMIAGKERGAPEAILLGALRTGQIHDRIADLLEGVEIPRDVAEGAEAKAFCDALRDQAAPHRDQAREAYIYCIDRSTVYQYFSDASWACEAALARIDPRLYPRLHEFTGEPSAGELGPWAEGVQFDPPPELAGE